MRVRAASTVAAALSVLSCSGSDLVVGGRGAAHGAHARHNAESVYGGGWFVCQPLAR